MMREAPPLAEFFKAVLAKLRQRMSPENFDAFVKECEEHPGEGATDHAKRNGR